MEEYKYKLLGKYSKEGISNINNHRFFILFDYDTNKYMATDCCKFYHDGHIVISYSYRNRSYKTFKAAEKYITQNYLYKLDEDYKLKLRAEKLEIF